MNDDDLASELRRRAAGGDVPDLRPAVRSAIDTRPQPVGVSRWAPFAGVAGVAAVLVLLVVAMPRLAPGSEPTRPDSVAPPPTTPEATALPASALLGCGSIWNYEYPSPVFVVDHAEAVRSCTAEPWDGEWPVGAADLFVQTGDEAGEIEVAWRREQLCRPERILVELSSTSEGVAIRLILDRSGPYPEECVINHNFAERAVLALAMPIDPAHVTVGSVIVPHRDPFRPLSRSFDCAPAEPVADGSPAAGGVPQLVDHTGVVTGCRQIEAAAQIQAGVAAKNLHGFESMRFDWLQTTCDGPVEAKFTGAVDGYELAVLQPLETCPPGIPVAIVVDYLIPMPSELLTAVFEEPARVFDCADTPGVTVVDEAGVVQSCAASASTASPGNELVLDNPGGDMSALQISWVAGSRCTYEVHVTPGDGGPSIHVYNMSKSCPGRDAVRSVTLHLTTPIPVHGLGWSIGGPPSSPPPAASPSPSQPPTPPASYPPRSTTLMDCEGGRAWPESGSVSMEDRTGHVIGCTVTDGPNPDDSSLASAAAPPRLFVEWVVPCATDGSVTQLQLWHREPRGQTGNPSLFQRPYVLLVDRWEPAGSAGCSDALSGRYVELELAEHIFSGDVEMFFTEGGRRGVDTEDFGGAGPNIELSINATTTEYPQGEAIEVGSSLTSDVDVTLRCGGYPSIAIEQLDGPLTFDPGPFVLGCPPDLDLRGGDRLGMSLAGVVSAAEEHSLDQYIVDGQLFLPPGTYRFVATASFGIHGILLPAVRLEASVVVTVR